MREFVLVTLTSSLPRRKGRSGKRGKTRGTCRNSRRSNHYVSRDSMRAPPARSSLKLFSVRMGTFSKDLSQQMNETHRMRATALFPIRGFALHLNPPYNSSVTINEMPRMRATATWQNAFWIKVARARATDTFARPIFSKEKKNRTSR